jgi:hypothetical protein
MLASLCLRSIRRLKPSSIQLLEQCTAVFVDRDVIVEQLAVKFDVGRQQTYRKSCPMSELPPISGPQGGRPSSPLWAMCGRLRVGKGFLYACSSGRSSHVFGLLARFT